MPRIPHWNMPRIPHWPVSAAALLCICAHSVGAQYLAVGMPTGTSGPLTIYTSSDGIYFNNVPVRYDNAPANVRNPFIVADHYNRPALIGGHYWLMHSTTGCCGDVDYQATSFALARTVRSNLHHWVFVKNVDSSIGIDGQYTWNPSPFISDDGVLHVINAIGCCATDGYTMQLYEQHAADSGNPAGDWSSPVRIPGLPDPSIDGTLVEDDRGIVSIFYKNDNYGITTVEAATSLGDLFGPYVLDRTGNWAGWENEGPAPSCGRESPSVFHTGGNAWTVYLTDWCPDPDVIEKYSIVDSSTWTWTPQQPIIQAPFASQAMQFYRLP